MTNTETPTPVRVLGIAGSLRKASFNALALRAAGEMLPAGMTLEVFDLAPIPLYNGDVEAEGMPGPVRDLQRRFAEANALLIATPEYNASVPGVLKNAINWASRPGPSGGSPLGGKPLAIFGASPSSLGTFRAQYHLRQVCVNVNLLPLQQPEVFIAQAHLKFDAQGRLTDEDTRQYLRRLLDALAAWTRRLRGESRPF